MTEALLLERREGVAIITLNQPARRNALSAELYCGLEQHISRLQDDPGCRAIVLTGGRHFCAGGELDGLSSVGLEMRAAMRVGHRALRAIVAGRIPVIAAVEGAAFGAGLSLAAACDFIVADSQSKFGAVYGKVGLMPDWGALWTLPQRIGLPRARRMAMFAEVIGGAEAHAIGLADFLAEDGAVLDTALQRAQQLAAAAPGAIAATKACLARAPQSLDALLDWEADTQALLIGSADFAEGSAAFVGKRAPAFLGQ
ncbi:MAG TPA: enoyl-CoA hydratase/isomerase family protein [Pseudoduganella sp.]|jgi:enoyl-CoA hydratase/carnithine racemase